MPNELDPESVAAQPGERPIIDAIVEASNAMKETQEQANAITDDLITRILLNPGGVVDVIMNSTVSQTDALAVADSLLADAITGDLLPALEPLEAESTALGVETGKVINA